MISDFNAMPSHHHFLCIDADADGRLLLVRTLLRVFPQAAIVEVQDYDTALSLLQTQTFDAVVAHRAVGADPLALIRRVREIAKEVPLLAVSSSGRAKEVLAAGATRFLNYDAWLLVGATVAAMLADECLNQASRGAILSQR